MPAPLGTLLTPIQASLAVVFSSVLGFTLALGFLPTAVELTEGALIWLGRSDLTPFAAFFGFPAFAAFFCYSLEQSASRRSHMDGNRSFSLRKPRHEATEVWKAALLPCLIALAVGPWLPFRPRWTDPAAPQVMLWILVVSPIAEEWLFRGWVYGIFERLYGPSAFSATNPLPVAVWASALAFALWHLQNAAGWPTALQVAYTAVLGLWLGRMRWQTGRIVDGMIAHALLNVSATLL